MKREQEVLLQFLGSTYGELKKLDENIVSTSTSLQRDKSKQLENLVRNMVSNPAPAPSPQVVTPQPQPGPTTGPVLPHQQVVDDPNQLLFNFDVDEKKELFSVLSKITKTLNDIKQSILELKTASTRNRRSS